MNGSILYFFFIVHWLAGPGFGLTIPPDLYSSNDSDTITDSFLDTDYRNYNISEDQLTDGAPTVPPLNHESAIEACAFKIDMFHTKTTKTAGGTLITVDFHITNNCTDVSIVDCPTSDSSVWDELFAICVGLDYFCLNVALALVQLTLIVLLTQQLRRQTIVVEEVRIMKIRCKRAYILAPSATSDPSYAGSDEAIDTPTN